MANNDIARIVALFEKNRRKWQKRALKAAQYSYASQRWRGYLPSEVPSELWEEYKTEVLGIQPKGEPPDE